MCVHPVAEEFKQKWDEAHKLNDAAAAGAPVLAAKTEDDDDDDDDDEEEVLKV